LPEDVREGGTGVSTSTVLPDEVEHCRPAYDLAGIDYGLGFLTRGCPHHCSWCFVPEKEGSIRAHAEWDEFAHPTGRDLILMDNNVLASDHGIQQIEAMAETGIRVDFNQGLDARLIDDDMARLLTRLSWIRMIRFACDSSSQKAPVERAVRRLRQHSPRKLSARNLTCYVLVRDGQIDSALDRVEFLRRLDVSPFAQPYRSPAGTLPSAEARKFARWVNRRELFFGDVSWEEFRGA